MKNVDLLVTNGTVLSGDKKNGVKADILIEADKIIAVSPGLGWTVQAKRTINAEGKFVMPGLVNAHTHSFENLLRGWFDGLPLELWMLLAYGPLNHGPFSKRMLYIRTLIGAVEMIRGGITTVLDHLTELPAVTVEGTETVFRAYRDAGLRVNVGLNVGNRPWHEAYPFLPKLLPEEVRSKLCSRNTVKSIVDVYRTIIGKWHGAEGRIQVVAAPSGPQRCTDELLIALNELATEFNLPVHTHALETLTQLATGKELYGKTIIQHLYNLGLLSKRVSLAHSIWVTEEDISLMAESGVSVVHNPVSNLSLGSGILPLRRLLDAGVNVGLGTDGISASGALNMFEAMKWALLIQRITRTDYLKWPTGAEVLKMATCNGARAVGLGETVGSLAAGKKADLIILDLVSANYVPLNEVGNQIVLSETGSSVNAVVVNGRLLMEDGKILTCDEKELLEEAREIAEEAKSVIERSHDFSSQLKPYVEQMYQQCAAAAKPVERLAIGAE